MTAIHNPFRGPRLALAVLAICLLSALARGDDKDRERKARAALAIAGARECAVAPKPHPKVDAAGGIGSALGQVRADSKCCPCEKCDCCEKCCGAGTCKYPDVAKVRDACTRVRRGGASGSGTCVWTDGKRSLVLTCSHVVDAGTGATEVRADGKWVKGDVVGQDPGADLACVLVPVAMTAAKVSAAAPGRGDEVLMVGCTTLWSRGKLSGETNLGGRAVFVLGYDSDSGDSGAGVFHRGELVGVHCGKVDAIQDGKPVALPYCTAAKPVRTFLAGVLADGKPVARAPEPKAEQPAARKVVGYQRVCGPNGCQLVPVYGPDDATPFAPPSFSPFGGCAGGACRPGR